MDLVVVTLLSLAIGVVTILIAALAIRRERGKPRGSLPGTGEHVIEVNYSSGIGGGQSSQIRVPRDPQAYAKRFVPAAAKQPKDTTP